MQVFRRDQDRGAPAFEGDPAAPEGGHIPGSINLPASGNLTPDGAFASDDVLRARFTAALKGDRPVGATCGSGVSAAHDLAALAILGVTAPLFPGSWSAWSADKARPIAYGRG
jgi:thiosulfate/3-mercaptopyruvate sulfurtransferase